MIAVTIGTGSEDFKFYANAASQRVQRYTGLKGYVLGDAELAEYARHPIFKLADKDYRRCFFLKFFLWDIFPNEDRILYHDADYCAVREWDPDKILADNQFCAVRDRTGGIQKELPYPGIFLYYFNAGFFLADRSSKTYFDVCVERAHKQKRKWNDQCVWSKVAADGVQKVKFLPKLYNMMDYGQSILDSNPYAIHTSANYDHYRAGTQMSIGTRLEWDLPAMQAQAGLNVCKDENELNAVFLLPDGTDSNGRMWFISGGAHYKMDEVGNWLKQVRYLKISDE